MGTMAWLKVLAQNRRMIFKVIREGFGDWCAGFTKHRAPASAPNSISN
jgi:hypothetical protein